MYEEKILGVSNRLDGDLAETIIDILGDETCSIAVDIVTKITTYPN